MRRFLKDIAGYVANVWGMTATLIARPASTKTNNVLTDTLMTPTNGQTLRVYLSGVSRDKLTTHFSPKEFMCHCKDPKCDGGYINAELACRLEHVRRELDAPILVTSGYRCRSRQNKLLEMGLSKTVMSQHILGRAADIQAQNMEELFAICKKYFSAIGDGRTRGFIHVDIREDKKRRWKY